jgi:hypothetical protein
MIDEQPVRARVDLERQELRAARRVLDLGPAFQSLNRWHTASRRSGAVVVGLLAGVAVAIGPVTGAVGVAVLLGYFAVGGKAGKAWERMTLESGRGDIVADRTGFTWTGPDGGSTSRRWASLLQMAATDDVIVGQYDPYNICVFPRRCFTPGDDEQLIAFAQAARAAPSQRDATEPHPPDTAHQSDDI